MNQIIEVNDATFDAEVKQSRIPVVVGFTADWCNPCKQIAPILEELSNEYDGKVKFVKLNIDGNPNATNEFRVQSIPALFLFQDGVMVSRKTTPATKTDLQSWINSDIV